VCVSLTCTTRSPAKPASRTGRHSRFSSQSQEPLIAQTARFFHALSDGDAATMRRVIEQFPEVARSSIHAACARCDADAVERWLAKDPATAKARFRDSGWTPLDCLAASPLFALDDAHRDGSVAIGRRLLALGADANTFTAAAERHERQAVRALSRE
jgi:hypothetical protein